MSRTDLSFPNTANLKGPAATIAIRPENITISTTGGALEGVVRHSFFFGDSTEFRVECGDHMFRISVKGANTTLFPNGTKVFLDFNKVLLF